MGSVACAILDSSAGRSESLLSQAAAGIMSRWRTSRTGPKPLAQRVAAEIHRDEPDPVRPHAPLPVLRRRMVDLEDPDPPGQRRPPGEGIQARAEQDVLSDAPPDAVGQAVLGVAAAAGHLRPGAGQDRVRAVRPVVGDELLGPFAQHGLGQRIGENYRGVVDDQVGGPRGRRGERGKARLSVSYHACQITIDFPP
jgi:hypothetical protein